MGGDDAAVPFAGVTSRSGPFFTKRLEFNFVTQSGEDHGIPNLGEEVGKRFPIRHMGNALELRF